jgi:D-3-phosphoglycerate dehydrogenase / 2-oxoglutarate reductase
MARILVSDKLSDNGLKILKDKGLDVDVKTGLSEAALIEIIGNYDALIVRSGTTVTAPIIQAASKLRVIGRAGIGVDNIDIAEASQKGIIVMNTPTGNAVTTAEHAIAMMFAVSRHIPQAMQDLKEGRWERKKYVGSQLCGKTLGIIGVGNIGKIVASRAKGLGMKLIGYDPFLSKEVAEKIGVESLTLDETLARADYVTIHTPKNDKTIGLINKQAFQKMKQGVILINCARGGIVVEEDLVWALNEGIVAGAALDVFEKEPPPVDHPLLKMPQLIYTPHLGASTDEAQENVALEVAELVAAYLTDGEIRNAVNVPSVSAETMRVIGPYLGLGEKLGSLQGQLAEQAPTEIQIEYCGEITQEDLRPITTATVRGLLVPILDDVTVNYVNAPLIAKERGIKVIESKVSEHSDFASLINVIVRTEKGERQISGTIFGRAHPRLVRINQFYLEAIPEGVMLYVHNEDKPGVIGKVGSLLGDMSINISRMQLGLKEDKAVALYSIDQTLDAHQLEKVKSLPHIISVKQVEL